jgi:hypothetical protein
MAGVAVRQHKHPGEVLLSSSLGSGLMNFVTGPHMLPLYGKHLDVPTPLNPIATPIGLGADCSGSVTVASLVPAMNYVVPQHTTLWAAFTLPSTSVAGTFVGIDEYPPADRGVHLGVGNATFDNAGNELIVLYGSSAWKASGVNIGTGVHTVAVVISTTSSLTYYIDGLQVATGTASTILLTGRAIMGTIASNTIGRKLSAGSVVQTAAWARPLSDPEILQLHRLAVQGLRT